MDTRSNRKLLLESNGSSIMQEYLTFKSSIYSNKIKSQGLMSGDGKRSHGKLDWGDGSKETSGTTGNLKPPRPSSTLLCVYTGHLGLSKSDTGKKAVIPIPSVSMWYTLLSFIGLSKLDGLVNSFLSLDHRNKPILFILAQCLFIAVKLFTNNLYSFN